MQHVCKRALTRKPRLSRGHGWRAIQDTQKQWQVGRSCGAKKLPRFNDGREFNPKGKAASGSRSSTANAKRLHLARCNSVANRYIGIFRYGGARSQRRKSLVDKNLQQFLKTLLFWQVWHKICLQSSRYNIKWKHVRQDAKAVRFDRDLGMGDGA